MKPTVVVKGEVLQFDSKNYTNKDGQAKVFTSCLVSFAGRVFDFGVGQGVDLNAYVRKGEKQIELELVTFKDLRPSLRVLSVK